jgi:translocation and assembly module TamA
MLRVVRSVAPASMPAFLCAAVLVLLTGCSLFSPKQSADSDATGSNAVAGAAHGSQRESFTVEVIAPDSVRDYLVRHLEIQRFRQLDDLGAVEVSRLMVAAEANARELLNTLGYFTPRLTLELKETPGAKAPREVLITVDPGEITRIATVQVDFAGPIAQEAASAARREQIRAAWTLRQGQPFNQQAWDSAKAAALRDLAARRYPTASVFSSQASIDADTSRAQLSVTYQSGPAYRFGPLVVHGNKRYDSDIVRRLARLPTGADYDQQQLLDAQQRLASSGYFNSVFLTLDTQGENPLAAPVVAQLNEAPLQRVVMGVGFTSDSGLRVSIDHSYNQLPVLDWRAVSKLSIDKDTQSLGTNWTAVPDDNGWRSFTTALVKSEVSGSYTLDSGRLQGGRSQSSDHIDRSYFLQYDDAENHGFAPPPSASALSVNWGWTGRYFDSNSAPTRGQGVALELGAGYTLTGDRLPFTRTYARWIGFVPAGKVENADKTQSRSARIQLRAEAGAVNAADRALIPSTLNFLTGGDTTVRGYSYRSIGAVEPDGQVIAGRYLAVASVEYQRPVVYDGQLTPWDGVAFVDAGAVADKPANFQTKVGVGFGARWASPIGPVQMDLAYGVQAHEFRLHFRLGFTF